MNKINTIILYDQDANCCYAVIRTKEEPSVVQKIIDDVKESLPGEWSYDDLKEGLMNSGIEYEIFEDTHYVNY